MGFFSNLFKKEPGNLKYVQSPGGSVPIYTSFGKDVYTSDAVQAAVHCIVNEMKKLAPQHVRKGADDKDTKSIDGPTQRVLDNPNPLMTTSDFIEKVVWELYQKFNAFVIPTFDVVKADEGGVRRRYTGLYPVSPSQTEIKEDVSGELFVKFWFPNGLQTTLLYSDVIHLRYRYSQNDYLGGDAYGDPDNDTLAETLSINKKILDGMASMMQSMGAVNGVVKYNTLMDRGLMESNIKEFNALLQSKSASGFLPLDLKAEFTQLKRDVKYIDPETIKFIDEKILRYFGVPLPILTGDYTSAQFEAFYDKTLEPLIVMFSQVFTKALFTPTERSFGNRIIFQPGEMVFMTVQEKLEMVRLLGDSGTLFENEKRRAFGLPAIPELEGVRMMSLNYVDSSLAEKYQTGQQEGVGDIDGTGD